MRILFVVAPGIGHLMPAVPTMWAARSAGHEVLVATSGPSLDMAARSGLSAVEVSDGGAADVYHRLAAWATKNRPERHDLADAWAQFTGAISGQWDSVADRLPESEREEVVTLALDVGGQMVDGIIGVIRNWRADLLVFTTFLAGGQPAATAAGIPCVLHGIGLPYPAFSTVVGAMTDVRNRYGVTGELDPPVATIDLCPASLRPPGADVGWPMRYVPYNGGAVLPDWLCAPPQRPRLCVTWGSVLPAIGCSTVVGEVMEVLAGEDAEIVLAVGESEPSLLGRLPSNVRTVDWVPLSALLPSCAAVVHHGGSGTTFTALAHGVPQVILPQSADQPVNAAAVARRGAGVALPERDIDPEALIGGIRRVLAEPAVCEASRQVQAEIGAMPGPEQIIRRLSEVAS